LAANRSRFSGLKIHLGVINELKLYLSPKIFLRKHSRSRTSIGFAELSAIGLIQDKAYFGSLNIQIGETSDWKKVDQQLWLRCKSKVVTEDPKEAWPAKNPEFLGHTIGHGF